MDKLTLVFAFASVVLAVQGVPLSNQANSKINEVQEEGILGSLSKCPTRQGLNEVINCAAVRVLRSIEQANLEQNIPLLPGVSIVAENPGANRAAKKLDEVALPTQSDQRANKLMSMLLESINRFVSGRTLKIRFPGTTPQNVARGLEEGRAKMKKMVGPLMLGLGATMVTVLPIMLGGLALLASKALLIGKVAFVVSIILFVQYFFSGVGGRNNWLGVYGTPSVPYTPSVYGSPSVYGTSYGYGTNNLGGWSSGQYPYARSMNINDEETNKSATSQDLAYSAHR